ncbi:MAG TPA: hypothetical protein VLT36_10445 [Candidatus Dormibacteraeota bacterium]|nr:hypothetical protein [Candidatus Dormibacteraeota bacterium]
MDKIEPYRQIVQLQAQIVRISQRNSQLKRRCEELEDELVARSPLLKEISAEQPPVPLVSKRPSLKARVWVLLGTVFPLRLLRV